MGVGTLRAWASASSSAARDAGTEPRGVVAGTRGGPSCPELAVVASVKNAAAPRGARDQHRRIIHAFPAVGCLTGRGLGDHTQGVDRRGRSDEDTTPLLVNPDPSFRS